MVESRHLPGKITKVGAFARYISRQLPRPKGLVARFAQYIHLHDGNIIGSDQHVDHEAGIFCMRLEWAMDGFRRSRAEVQKDFAVYADEFAMVWQLRFSDERPKIALWVSRQDHCLIDLLGQHQAGELGGELVAIVSNHELLRPVAKMYEVPFHFLPVDAKTRPAQEAAAFNLMRSLGVDLVVLAKYMQILSAELLAALPQVINIHHSFLPAFPGGSPYHQAFARGVKLIGATAHYATEELDSGPIIEQEVCRVTHRDSIESMIRKGRDLERLVLSRAVYLHLKYRILVYGNKTAVFD